MSDHNENDRSVRAAQGMQHKAQGVHARKSGQIDMSAVPSAAVELGHIFADAGYELALVGGSVRDILLGRPAHDLDFCTSAKPEEFEPLLRQWGDGFWARLSICRTGQMYPLRSLRIAVMLMSRSPGSLRSIMELRSRGTFHGVILQ